MLHLVEKRLIKVHRFPEFRRNADLFVEQLSPTRVIRHRKLETLLDYVFQAIAFVPVVFIQ